MLIYRKVEQGVDRGGSESCGGILIGVGEAIQPFKGKEPKVLKSLDDVLAYSLLCIATG